MCYRQFYAQLCSCGAAISTTYISHYFLLAKDPCVTRVSSKIRQPIAPSPHSLRQVLPLHYPITSQKINYCEFGYVTIKDQGIEYGRRYDDDHDYNDDMTRGYNERYSYIMNDAANILVITPSPLPLMRFSHSSATPPILQKQPTVIDSR